MSNEMESELKRRAERRMTALDEIASQQEMLKDWKAEDKADGFSERALGQVIKEMRRGPEYQAAQLSLELEVDTYRRACGLPQTLDVAQAEIARTKQAVPEPKQSERRRKVS